MPRNFTTPETKEIILNLWNEGYSAKRIGLHLGMSLNSVAGIVHRLRKAGFKVRTEAIYSNKKSKPPLPNLKRKHIPTSEIIPKGFKQPKRVTKSKERWVPLLALDDRTCRYTKDGKLYCNAKATSKEGGYCEEHIGIMYNKGHYIPTYKKLSS